MIAFHLTPHWGNRRVFLESALICLCTWFYCDHLKALASHQLLDNNGEIVFNESSDCTSWRWAKGFKNFEGGMLSRKTLWGNLIEDNFSFNEGKEKKTSRKQAQHLLRFKPITSWLKDIKSTTALHPLPTKEMYLALHWPRFGSIPFCQKSVARQSIGRPCHKVDCRIELN